VRRTLLVIVLVCAWAAGCGGGDDPAPPPIPRGDPVLGRAEARRGEILIRGELTPASHGPYRLAGRYRVAFEQYAPEDPEVDFSQQTSFVATLDKRAEIEGRGSIRLFRTSRRAVAKQLELRGSYFVDVSFGDFPYVLRLTPIR
jgi:hypothetical protein